MIFLDVITDMSIGLLIGTELSVSIFVNPILARLDTGTRMVAVSYFAKRLGKAMPFWYVVTALLLLAETVIRWHAGNDTLLVTATGLWFAVIVLTLILLVPINNRMMQLNSGSAESSLAEHRTWDLLHRGRVAVLTISMICFLIGVRIAV